MTTMHHPPRLFVTGTDTNVGKTHVTCLIVRQLVAQGCCVAAYKPVCSGAVATSPDAPDSALNDAYRWEDVDRLKSAIGGNWSADQICPQRFEAPLAPPVAARLEGRFVDFDLLVQGADQFDAADILLIEGAGGWLSPVTDTKLVADLAVALNAPVLIVARSGLGTINHTLMTIESVRARRLAVAGVILNEVVHGQSDISSLTNASEIEAYSGVPVFGTVRYGSEREIFHSERLVSINWRLLAQGALAVGERKFCRQP
jgi:dethiobiotin synthetase